MKKWENIGIWIVILTMTFLAGSQQYLNNRLKDNQIELIEAVKLMGDQSNENREIIKAILSNILDLQVEDFELKTEELEAIEEETL